tara:strand:+ start:51 stop:749 length:699 start_codon:yes stop_codon:yes gene_type:complete
MKKHKVFIACDTSNLRLVKKIINQTKKIKELNLIPKFGLQFFYSKNGRNFLEKFKGEFFLDIKAADISTTAESAIDSIKDLKGCRYITIHAHGGLEMMKAVKKKAREINKKIKILGITVLTSLDNKALKEIGHMRSVKQLVLRQASLIKKSGIDGCVLSGQEAKIVKKKYKNLFVVTPGIRLPGDKKDDQSRVVTPRDAFVKFKADAIVMGRSLTKNNIKKNIQKLIDHLNQ